MIYSVVNMVNEFLWNNNILVVVLVLAALVNTHRTRFVQVRLLPDMLKGLTRKKDDSGISSVETLLLSTATRVGAGNIVGVIAAISVGGSGSIFWMIVIAILGSATAFVESTLSVMYRDKLEDGMYIGGTPYIFKKALNMKYMGVFYAIFSIITYLGVTQIMSNTIVTSIDAVYSVDIKYLSAAIGVIFIAIVFNKNKSTEYVVDITNKIVPIMAIVYLIIVVYAIVFNIQRVPSVIYDIVKNAFGGEQLLGGAFGTALMYGIRRGLFSNEAGSGNSNYASSKVSTNDAVSQGFVQVIGVFVDTVIICSATAFLVLLAPKSNLSGMDLFTEVMTYHVGFIGKYVSIIIMFFFCMSTILAITLYGKSALYFVSKNKNLEIVYKFFVSYMIFEGGMSTNLFVWSLADFGLGMMTILNAYVVFKLGSQAVDMLIKYEKSRENK